MIGALHPDRHQCGETHLPNCHNPSLDLTACVCGASWWRGDVGTWHSLVQRVQTGWTTGGRGIYETTGWDRYFLHAAGCDDGRTTPELGHVCGGGVAVTAAEVFGAVGL